MLITKDEKQKFIIDEWIKNNYRGYVSAVTGFGKTLTCIKAIKALPDTIRVIIVVPRQVLLDQWELELAKHSIKNVKVYVVNTFVKTDMICDLLIQDEVQLLINSDAILFSKSIHDSTFKYYLALSATIPKEHRVIMESKGINCICEIGIKEALVNKWVSPVQEIVINVELTEDEKKSYLELETSCKYFFKTFNFQWKDLQKCLSKTSIDSYIAFRNKGLVNTDPRYLDKATASFHAFRYMTFLKKKKDIIFHAYNKYQIIKDILLNHEGERTIIFSESTLFSESLQSELDNSTIYHSGLKPASKKKVNLKLFTDKKVNTLVTVKSLDQGFSDDSITLGIISSGTSSNIQMKQRVGRLLRYVEDKISYLYILVVKDTQDENWHINRTKKLA